MQKKRKALIVLGIFLIIVGLALPPMAFVGGEFMVLEVVKSEESQARGLSGRIEVPPNYGMLFVFKEDGQYGFWMKDMQVPIDIFWLTKDGEVVHVERGVTPESFPNTFTNITPARYVLETRSGVAAIHNIDIGSMVRFVSLPPWSGVVPSLFTLIN
jgi:uncharacterized membrane protein (UPF0127 family)